MHQMHQHLCQQELLRMPATQSKISYRDSAQGKLSHVGKEGACGRLRARSGTFHEEKSDQNFEHSCEFEVRDYELDQYGVVNNAVYVHYLQYGRLKFLNDIDIDVDVIAKTGNAFALSELKLNFRGPLRSLDRVRCVSRCGKSSPARIQLHQTLWKLSSQPNESHLMVLEADLVLVTLDKRYKPKRFPKNVIQALMTGRATDDLTKALIDS